MVAKPDCAKGARSERHIPVQDMKCLSTYAVVHGSNMGDLLKSQPKPGDSFILPCPSQNVAHDFTLQVGLRAPSRWFFEPPGVQSAG